MADTDPYRAAYLGPQITRQYVGSQYDPLGQLGPLKIAADMVCAKYKAFVTAEHELSAAAARLDVAAAQVSRCRDELARARADLSKTAIGSDA